MIYQYNVFVGYPAVYYGTIKARDRQRALQIVANILESRGCESVAIDTGLDCVFFFAWQDEAGVIYAKDPGTDGTTYCSHSASVETPYIFTL